jgi:hypothetical protein
MISMTQAVDLPEPNGPMIMRTSASEVWKRYPVGEQR